MCGDYDGEIRGEQYREKSLCSHGEADNDVMTVRGDAASRRNDDERGEMLERSRCGFIYCSLGIARSYRNMLE